MTKTYRALAALLSYPEPALIEALAEIRAEVPVQALPIVEELRSRELLSSQERYVALFDRSRALSLHLFEHVHGESRDRGQAMVDLQAMYEQRGLRPAGGELPDYLPVFLEFLSLVEANEARAQLADTAHILRTLGERLAARGSAYAGVLSALLVLAGEAPLANREKPLVPKENPVLLDQEWRDPEVTFGGPQPVRLYRKGVAA